MNYLNHKFIEYFSESNIPKWKCSYCKKGILSLKYESLSYTETPESKKLRSDESWDPDWLDYRFSAIFTCGTCTGDTYVCGRAAHVCCHSIDPDEESFEEMQFTPSYFEPAIRLIDIPKSCPENIVKTLDGAFAVAWTDVASGCNKLRVALEKLVFELNPVSTGNLHQKITNLENSHAEIYSLLMAIKWLGNDASHDDSLKECDLAFGFRVMSSVLKEIYDDDRAEINELVQIVNLMKGSPAKT